MSRRVGLVGCGRWGRHILRDLVDLGASVVAVARSEESRGRAAEGGASIVASTQDLPEVDGIVVATPSATHADVVESVLPRGVPVFVEKPLAPDATRAEAIAQLAPDRVFVMDKWRYHPGVELLRDLAGGGELGGVVGLETIRTGWGRLHDDADPIWHLAPHDLSIALEVLGGIPDPLAAVADVAEGVPVGLTAVLGSDPWLSIQVSGRSPTRRREIVLRCEGGVAVLGDGYADHVLVARRVGAQDSAPEDAERRPIPGDLPLRRELQAFLAHLDGGPPPRSSAREGARSVRMLGELRRLAGLDRPQAIG